MTDHVIMDQPLGAFARSLFKRAQDYLYALHLMTIASPQPEFAAYFIFSHSLELLLKSYLAATGVSQNEIEFDLVHDMPAIFKRCEALALPQVSGLEAYVLHTHEMNKDHDFRYPSICRTTMPKLADCLAIARELEENLKPIVSAAAIKSQNTPTRNGS